MEQRILDDHLHDVPEPVFELLRFVASRAAQPLTVILERDGGFPSMASLLEQLDRARAAMEIGRAEAEDEIGTLAGSAAKSGMEIVSTPEFEAVLARLYSDQEFRQRFVDAPAAALAQSGLSENQCALWLRLIEKDYCWLPRVLPIRKQNSCPPGRSARFVCYNQYSNAVD